MGIELKAEEILSMISESKDTIILDIRPESEYMAGHVKGAANARCESMQQKQIIMAKLPRGSKIVIIDADGQGSMQNAQMMSQFGFDAHYLEGGMNSWSKEIVSTSQSPLTSGSQLYSELGNENVFLLDVREPEEFANHKIEGAVNIPLAKLFENGACNDIPKDKKIVTICSHGNRSMVATFALSKNGFESTSLDGGMSGWSQVLVSSTIHDENDIKIIQIEKVGKGCLSYMIISKDEAMVVDTVHPLSKYKEIAKAENVKIVAIADTHCHADHISASRELAATIGAKLYLGSAENYSIESVKVTEGDTISFGDKTIRVMSIPGHTIGSVAYVLDKIALCGDTVFSDGVGRPDLHDAASESASALYDTLHEKFSSLDKDTRILPSHHGDTTLSSDNGGYWVTMDNLQSNEMYASTKENFVERIIKMIPPKPPNYTMIIRFNSGSSPLNPMMIPDLEAGPNRCAVRT